MIETSQFKLPLLSGSQAQKHVTVNEAMSVIDAVAQLRLVSSNLVMPPASVTDGDAFCVKSGATGEWFGQDGKIAISCNGGWRFLSPKVGWQAFNIETGTNQLFDGTDWLDSTLAATTSGSATEYEIVEIDHQISVGATSTTSAVIPQNAQVIGVTGRVIQAMSGALTGWKLGVAGAPDRFGQGLGTALNSYVLGMSGSPTTYYSDTELLLTSEGDDFTDGTVRLAVHFVSLSPPRSI